MEVQLKSAREMFEELGYEYRECYCKHELERIIYVVDERYSPDIIFCMSSKMYMVELEGDCASWVDIQTHKAINKQIEELGWNNE